MNDDDRIAFVDAVRLQGTGVPAPTRSARSPFGLTASELEAVASEEARSVVVGGGALSFAAGVRGRVRQDVLDGTLLAQLSANAEHDPVEDSVAWYRRYTEVLEHLGWTLQGRTFTERGSSGANVQLSREALELLRAVVSGPDLGVLRGALDALGALPDDARALSIFDGNAAAGSGGIFQLGAARQAEDGLVALGLGTSTTAPKNAAASSCSSPGATTRWASPSRWSGPPSTPRRTLRCVPWSTAS